MDIDFLRKRPMVFRRELLDHYAELGLTETDLVILMKLIYEMNIPINNPQFNIYAKEQQ